MAAADLGVTLIHEHLFVRDPEVERNLPGSEWDAEALVERGRQLLETLYELGIRTVVDLTVPGLGRDVRTVAAVAESSPMQVVAATGWYATSSLPLYFQLHGPGRPLGGPDDLARLFLRDIEEGIEGTAVRAGMIKVVTDAAGITEDVAWVMDAAAAAHLASGVTITTHSHPASRNGLAQQAFLRARGVPLERVVIGHSGDTEDLDYLRALLDEGSTIGMDRFGMEHVLADERRVGTVLALLRLGYGDRMVLSHDAAVFSYVTPPSWRSRMAPRWAMETIPRRIVPMLREGGATDEDLHRMLVENPRRLLAPPRRRRASPPSRAPWTIITRGVGHEGGAAAPTGRDGHRRRARARAGSGRRAGRGRRRGPVRLRPRRLPRDLDAAPLSVDPGSRGLRHGGGRRRARAGRAHRRGRRDRAERRLLRLCAVPARPHVRLRQPPVRGHEPGRRARGEAGGPERQRVGAPRRRRAGPRVRGAPGRRRGRVPPARRAVGPRRRS